MLKIHRPTQWTAANVRHGQLRVRNTFDAVVVVTVAVNSYSNAPRPLNSRALRHTASQYAYGQAFSRAR